MSKAVSTKIAAPPIFIHKDHANIIPMIKMVEYWLLPDVHWNSLEF